MIGAASHIGPVAGWLFVVSFCMIVLGALYWVAVGVMSR